MLRFDRQMLAPLEREGRVIAAYLDLAAQGDDEGNLGALGA